MKRLIIFLITFLFFALGVQNAFAMNSYVRNVNINGVEYYFEYGRLYKSSNDILVKTICSNCNGLYFDAGNGKYFFEQSRNFFYINDDLSYTQIPNGCRADNSATLYNGEWNCSKPSFNGFERNDKNLIFGNKSFYKKNSDGSHTIRAYSINGNDETVHDVIFQGGIFNHDIFSFQNSPSSLSFYTATYNQSTKKTDYKVMNYDFSDSTLQEHDYSGTFSFGSWNSDGSYNYSLDGVSKKAKFNIKKDSEKPGFTGKIVNIPNLVEKCHEYTGKIPKCGTGKILSNNNTSGVKKGDMLECVNGFSLEEYSLIGKKTFSFLSYSGGERIKTCGYLSEELKPKKPCPAPYSPGACYDDPNYNPDNNGPEGPQPQPPENPNNEQPKEQPEQPKQEKDYSGFLGGIQKAIDNLKDGFTSIKNAISSGVSKIGEFFGGLGNSIANGFLALKEGLGNFFGGLSDSIGNGLKSLKDGLGTILSGISDAIGTGFDKIASLFGDFSGVKLDSNGIDYNNFGTIKTNGEGFLNIGNGTINNPVLDGTKCKLFAENSLNFLYYSNRSFSLNFSFTQFQILDNKFFGFFDFVFGLITGPINNIIAVAGVITPFSFDNQQVCLFGEVKTIEFHKMMKDTEYYGEMTMFDYLVIFVFGSFIFFIIGGISFFRGISTPEGKFDPYLRRPYSQKGVVYTPKPENRYGLPKPKDKYKYGEYKIYR